MMKLGARATALANPHADDVATAGADISQKQCGMLPDRADPL